MSYRKILAPLFCTTLVLAACGGGSDDDGSSEAPSTVAPENTPTEDDTNTTNVGSEDENNEDHRSELEKVLVGDTNAAAFQGDLCDRLGTPPEELKGIIGGEQVVTRASLASPDEVLSSRRIISNINGGCTWTVTSFLDNGTTDSVDFVFSVGSSESSPELVETYIRDRDELVNDALRHVYSIVTNGIAIYLTTADEQADGEEQRIFDSALLSNGSEVIEVQVGGWRTGEPYSDDDGRLQTVTVSSSGYDVDAAWEAAIASARTAVLR